MNIELEVSEPWDIPIELSRTILLEADDDQPPDVWQVCVVSGWRESGDSTLSLRPRYEGDTLAELRDGKSIFVNLVRLTHSNEHREMVIGKASIIQDLR